MQRSNRFRSSCAHGSRRECSPSALRHVRGFEYHGRPCAVRGDSRAIIEPEIRSSQRRDGRVVEGAPLLRV
jgi:hypothetical protein